MTSIRRADRDISRQNKANSVVKATMFSELCADSLGVLDKILSNIHSIIQYTDVAIKVSPLYKQMKDIISICISTVNSSSRLHMRCNTLTRCQDGIE